MDTGRWRGTWILLALIISYTSGQAPVSRRRPYGDGAARRRLNIVTLQSEPYIRLKWSPGLIGNERYEGYYKELISRLADLAGFDYRLHLVADGKLGQQGEDGSWDGMVGKVIERTADLTLGPLSIFRERQNVVDFTSPIEEVQLTVLIARPEGSTPPREIPLSELLSKTDVKFAALRESDAVRALMTSSEPTLRSLYRRLLQQNTNAFMSNMYEALEYVRRERFVLILDSGMADYYIGREPCDLSRITTFPGERHYALAARKGDPIIGEINRAIERLKGQGSDWLELKRKWWQAQCPGMTFETLGLPQRKGKVDEDKLDQSSSTMQPMLHLRITSLLSPPFVIASPEPGGQLTGYTIDLLDHVSHIVPFTYDLSFPKDNKGFGKRKRGRWSGMAGELLRDEKDLAAAPFTSDHQRDRVLTYTKPFLHSTLSILTRISSTEEEIPIFFMEDLLNQTEYKYGVLKGSHLERELKHSKDDVPRNIWRNIVKDKRNNVVRTLEEGVRKVRNEKFAFILPSTYATYLSSKGVCDLMALDQFMFITNYMFAVKMDNLLVEKIDEAFIKLQQDGVLQMLFHKWWNTGDCLGATEPAKIYENGFNATDDPNNKESWVHDLITFSTKWKNPLGSPTTPIPNHESSSEDEESIPVTDTNSSRSSTERPIVRTVLSNKIRPMTYTVPTTTSSTTPSTKPERNHRHRHRHREGKRKDKKNRRRNRQRNRERIETTPSMINLTETVRLIPEVDSAFSPALNPAQNTTIQTTTVTTTTQTPAKWDGKDIFGDFYSTREPGEPGNFSLDLELEPNVEVADDNLRIFPFTYKPKIKTENGVTDMKTDVVEQVSTTQIASSTTEVHDFLDEDDYDYDESGEDDNDLDMNEEPGDISIDEDIVDNDVVVITSSPTQIYSSIYPWRPTKPSETSTASISSISQTTFLFLILSILISQG